MRILSLCFFVIMRWLIKTIKTNFALKVGFVSLGICYYFGVFTMILERSYDEIHHFLPANISNYILQLERNQTPGMRPIGFYNYSFITNSKDKCFPEEDFPLRLVYIVKSAAQHFERRDAIRKSWGFQKRFSDVNIKTVFLLGLPYDESIQVKINQESREKGDIIQGAFLDSYFNNTIKTMMGLKWAYTFCKESKFYFFSDDDMFVSTKNVLKFLRNPLEYPQYLEVPFASVQRNEAQKKSNQWPLSQVLDIELPHDAELFAGYMFPNSRPHRHLSSKWYISLEEYPYSRYPPYITAGAFVLSNAALRKFYLASFYVKPFRFDDIYLSFLAKLSNIVPLHSDEFYFYKKKYTPADYKYVVASHGYGDPEELLRVWSEQKSLGSA